MKIAPTPIAHPATSTSPRPRVRKSPEERLEAAQLAAQRAGALIRQRNKKNHAAQVRLAGEFVLRRAEDNPQARALLAALKQSLTRPADRAAFGLPILGDRPKAAPTSVDSYSAAEVEAVEAQITAALGRYKAAADDMARELAEADAFNAILEWETMTGRLHAHRPANWEKAPGSRKKV